MFELNCQGVIPGCNRIIQGDSQAEVFRRAVQQAHQSGIERLTPDLVDIMRERTTERPN